MQVINQKMLKKFERRYYKLSNPYALTNGRFIKKFVNVVFHYDVDASSLALAFDLTHEAVEILCKWFALFVNVSII